MNLEINTGSLVTRIRKLKEILQRRLKNWTGMEPLFRWIVASAVLESTELEDQMWFARILANHPLFKNTSAETHIAGLRSFIWMEDVFEERVPRLVAQIMDISHAANRATDSSCPMVQP